ncbi:MAG: cytochrome c3 family protein [Nitrospirota bacterium]
MAGGNFRYLTTSDSRGHNIKDIGNADDVLNAAPGLYPASGHNMKIIDTNLTCAGDVGCHGNRSSTFGTGIRALKGAHHQNVDGKCDTANTIANSYRFLSGVKGLENTTDKWQNKDKNSHNEYFGATSPKTFSTCSSVDCHGGNGVFSSNGSISVFCGTCHGDFHRIGGIGGDTVSPFTRHPTDISLPASGEYTAYTTYSVVAPVARTTVPDSPSSTVDPTGSTDDIVMCLSCHGAHGTNYPDILRWDYSTMIAGGGGSGGCFTCHTRKSQNP